MHPAPAQVQVVVSSQPEVEDDVVEAAPEVAVVEDVVVEAPAPEPPVPSPPSRSHSRMQLDASSANAGSAPVRSSIGAAPCCIHAAAPRTMRAKPAEG